MVRVEVSELPEGFEQVVRGTLPRGAEELRFNDLQMALGRPGAEDFELLQERAFILEVELDDSEEIRVFRREVEEALNGLGASWVTAEFDEEDTMSGRKTSRRMGDWD